MFVVCYGPSPSSNNGPVQLSNHIKYSRSLYFVYWTLIIIWFITERDIPIWFQGQAPAAAGPGSLVTTLCRRPRARAHKVTRSCWPRSPRSRGAAAWTRTSASGQWWGPRLVTTSLGPQVMRAGRERDNHFITNWISVKRNLMKPK